MVDIEHINQRLANLEEQLSILNHMKSVSKEEFKTNPEKHMTVRLALQLAIESCHDIGNYLVSLLGLRRPESYADLFKILGENDIIDTKFSEELVNMARFRNRLVHLYWKVDLDEVYNIFQDKLGDFLRFRKEIVEFIKKQRPGAI